MINNKWSWKKKVIVFFSFLTLLFVLASIITTIVISSNTVLTYNGLSISKDVYAYLQAHCRYEFLVEHKDDGLKDIELSWNAKPSGSDLTWRELCEEETRLYISRILIASSLYDQSGVSLEENYYNSIESTLENILTNKFDGTIKTYNEEAKELGFSYSSMKKAFLLEMKSIALSDCSSTTDSLVAAQYFVFYYTRVQLLYIPRSNVNYDTLVSEVRSTLEASPTEETFLTLVDPDSGYNFNPSFTDYPNGLYFSSESQYTEDYASHLEDLVEGALNLQHNGDYIEVSCENESDGIDGTYFVMKMPLEENAYSNSAYSTFFSDFDSNKNAFYLLSWIDSQLDYVEWKEQNIPYLAPQGFRSELYRFFQ